MAPESAQNLKILRSFLIFMKKFVKINLMIFSKSIPRCTAHISEKRILANLPKFDHQAKLLKIPFL